MQQGASAGSTWFRDVFSPTLTSWYLCWWVVFSQYCGRHSNGAWHFAVLKLVR